MTRISQAALNRNVLFYNQGNLGRSAELQQQLASGKRINRMSDDPTSAKRSLGFRIEQFELERFQNNISRTLAFQQATDSTFTGMTEIIDEAKAVAVRGSNATEDAASRQVLAQQVDGYIQRTIDLGNTVHDGRYIYAGAAVLTEPFALSADGSRVDYMGDLDTFEVDISPSSRSEVNANGHELFKQEVDVFAAMIELRDALNADDPEAIRESITALDAAQVHIGNQQGALGAQVQRVELTREQLSDAVINLGELISAEEDVDLAETISNLQIAEVALQAGLNAGARVLQPTLLEFL